MAEQGLLKLNKVKIVGTVTDVVTKKDVSKKTNKSYISVDATITSKADNGTDNIFVINFYSNENVQGGGISKLYTQYDGIAGLKGHKVEVTGELTESRFYSTKTSKMASDQKIKGKFIKSVVDVTPDVATFEVGGFLVSPLTEKVNKDNELYGYELILGQSNHNDTMLINFRLNIELDNTIVINGCKALAVGQTYRFIGKLSSVIETVTKVDEDTGFGEPVVRTYTSTRKSYFITNGSKPVTDERAYSQDLIKNLITAYKENDVQLENEAKAKAGSEAADVETTNVAPTATVRQASLL